MNRIVVCVLVTLLTVTGTSAAHADPAQPDKSDGDGWVVKEGDVTIEFTPRPSEALRDASGCNGSVCIYLKGAGRTLTRWRTTAYVSSADCAAARYWTNGRLARSTRNYCTNGPGTLTATWHNPGTFPDNTRACNSWTNINGYPCKMVRS